MKNKFTMEFLKERARECLALAKTFLEKGEQIAPVALFGIYGQGEEPMILNMMPHAKEGEYRKVQFIILNNNPPPDYCIHVSDAWMLNLSKDEKKAEQIRKTYKPGQIAEDPEKVETIVVFAGSELGTFGILQQYRREDGKIIFEEVIEMGEDVEAAIFSNVWEVRKAAKITPKSKTTH